MKVNIPEISSKLMLSILGHEKTDFICLVVNLPDDFDRNDKEAMRYVRSQIVSWFISEQGSEFVGRIALPRHRPFSTKDLLSLSSCVFYSEDHEIVELPDRDGDGCTYVKVSSKTHYDSSEIKLSNFKVMSLP